MNNEKIQKIFSQCLIISVSLTQNSLAVSRTKPKYTTHVIDANIKTSENDKKPFYKGRGVKIAAASVISLVTLGAGSILAYKNYQSKIEDAKKQAANKVKDEKFINSLKSAIETGDLGSKESEDSARVFETLYPDYVGKLKEEILKEYAKNPNTTLINGSSNVVEFFEEFRRSHLKIFRNLKYDFAIFLSGFVLAKLELRKMGIEIELSSVTKKPDKEFIERNLTGQSKDISQNKNSIFTPSESKEIQELRLKKEAEKQEEFLKMTDEIIKKDNKKIEIQRIQRKETEKRFANNSR